MLEPIMSTKPVDRCQFKRLENTLDELLYTAEGINQLGSLLMTVELGVEPRTQTDDTSYLVQALAKHVQHLRNEAAKELEPIYESFGVEPIGY